jgi:RNA polymerase sigma factor (sigma-70 family)
MGNEAQPSDVELLLALETSPDAFEIFYRRHVKAITRFLAQRLRTPEDVADGVAATFLAVLVSADTFDAQRGSPTAWLYAIARNEARGQSRSIGRREALRVRLQGSALLSHEDSERLAELIDVQRAAGRLGDALSAASDGELELLGHIVTNNMTVAQAARSIGIAPAAGRKRMQRLRGRVRNAIDYPPGLEHQPLSTTEEP